MGADPGAGRRARGVVLPLMSSTPPFLLPARCVAAVLAIALALGACDNEVPLFTPAEEGGSLPVVFGLVNTAVDTQYISLTRTFRFEPGSSAFESAADPDSLYFGPDAVSATMTNERTGASTTLTRVNLADRGIEREPGDFPVSPNILYRFRLSAIGAEPGDSLRLSIAGDGGIDASAAIAVLSTLEFRSPPQPLPPTRYNFVGRSPLTFSWNNRNDGAPLAAYEVGFEFVFSESTQATGSRERTLYYRPAQEVSTRSSTFSIRLEGLLPFLATELEADPAISREVIGVRLVITGGDDNYGQYLELVNANSGITATQELPAFTNVRGGLGLLGSITTLRQRELASISPATFDSLRMSRTTRGLNF